MSGKIKPIKPISQMTEEEWKELWEEARTREEKWMLQDMIELEKWWREWWEKEGEKLCEEYREKEIKSLRRREKVGVYIISVLLLIVLVLGGCIRHLKDEIRFLEAQNYLLELQNYHLEEQNQLLEILGRRNKGGKDKK